MHTFAAATQAHPSTELVSVLIAIVLTGLLIRWVFGARHTCRRCYGNGYVKGVFGGTRRCPRCNP